MTNRTNWVTKTNPSVQVAVGIAGSAAAEAGQRSAAADSYRSAAEALVLVWAHAVHPAEPAGSVFLADRVEARQCAAEVREHRVPRWVACPVTVRVGKCVAAQAENTDFNAVQDMDLTPA